MSLFSERYGYVVKPLQFESMTPELRNRIWNIYTSEVCTDWLGQDSNYMEELMDLFGLTFKNVYEEEDIKNNLQAFQKWYMAANWYEVYDFIEAYLAFLPNGARNDAIQNFNNVMKWDNAGYRIVGRMVMPITNQEELINIEQAQTTEYESVNKHIVKAMQLFLSAPHRILKTLLKSQSVRSKLCAALLQATKGNIG